MATSRPRARLSSGPRSAGAARGPDMATLSLPCRRVCDRIVVFSLLAAIPVASVARASWPDRPDVNLPLCTAPGSQGQPDIVADGVGGAIVTWVDERRGGDLEIYAQRVDRGGTPMWAADGVPICMAPGDQWAPRTICDGAQG